MSAWFQFVKPCRGCILIFSSSFSHAVCWNRGSFDLTVNIDRGPRKQKHSAEHMKLMRDFCRVLIKYVNEVDPSVVDSFEHSGPPQVVDAMQAAVIGLCGHLPPQFFEINVVTLGENLRMLMHSFMSTGYLYRHIADHLDMQAGVDRALPSGVLQDDLEQDLAPGRSYGWRSQNWDGYAKVCLHILLLAPSLQQHNSMMSSMIHVEVIAAFFAVTVIDGHSMVWEVGMMINLLITIFRLNSMMNLTVALH